MGLFPIGWKVPTTVRRGKYEVKIMNGRVGHELEGFDGYPVGPGGFFGV